MPPAGPSFYAHIFHPAFNLDMDDTIETTDKFANHTRAVGKGVQGLRNVFGQLRQARIGKCSLSFLNDFYSSSFKEMSKAERLLSYSLLSLITSKPLATASTNGISDVYEEHNISDKGKGTMNVDGAWCWREGCEGQLALYSRPPEADLFTECLKLTKSMQRTCESLQSVADLYDDHVRHKF